MHIKHIRAGFLALVFLLMASSSIQAVTHVQPPYVAGEMLVKFRIREAPDQGETSRCVLPLSNIQTFEKSGISRVSVPDDMTVDQAVALYNARPDVIYAEPNYRYRLHALPDDPQMHQLWGLVNRGQTIQGVAGTMDADLDAEQAWDLETGSRDVVVAVVDSGVDIKHPDLSDNIWTNPHEIINGIDDDGNGYIDDVHGWDFTTHTNDPVDTHGHGTRVAGIIGAVGNNAIGMSGLCWKVSIMPLRFISAADYGTVANAIDAIEYADAKGAHVINLSWGGPDYSQALKDAIDAADALVVCAAGNEGKDLTVSPNYPASYDSANILSVGASNMDDAPAWFTNYSDHWVDVAAPGTDIYSTAPGRRTIYADDFRDLAAWDCGGTGPAWSLLPDPDDTALTVSPNGDYANNINTWVRLGPLDLSGCSGARLDFTVRGTTADSGDRLYVEASHDGADWSPLWLGQPDGPVRAITGSFRDWQLTTADLKPYDQTAAFFIRLRFVSDDAGRENGYLIDHLSITCAAPGLAKGDYQYDQGTSLSTAYVSGTAALIMAQKPSLTPTEVKLSIESTVDDNPSLDGMVAAAGRVNVHRALVSVASVDLYSSAADATRIALDWTAHEPVDSGFEIQRRQASGVDYATIAIVGAKELEYTDTGLSAGTTYIYRLLTLSGTDRTGYSNETIATTPQALIRHTSSAGESSGGGGGGCFISTLDGATHIPGRTSHRIIFSMAVLSLCLAGLLTKPTLWSNSEVIQK